MMSVIFVKQGDQGVDVEQRSHESDTKLFAKLVDERVRDDGTTRGNRPEAVEIALRPARRRRIRPRAQRLAHQVGHELSRRLPFPSGELLGRNWEIVVNVERGAHRLPSDPVESNLRFNGG